MKIESRQPVDYATRKSAEPTVSATVVSEFKTLLADDEDGEGGGETAESLLKRQQKGGQVTEEDLRKLMESGGDLDIQDLLKFSQGGTELSADFLLDWHEKGGTLVREGLLKFQKDGTKLSSEDLVRFMKQGGDFDGTGLLRHVRQGGEVSAEDLKTLQAAGLKLTAGDLASLRKEGVELKGSDIVGFQAEGMEIKEKDLLALAKAGIKFSTDDFTAIQEAGTPIGDKTEDALRELGMELPDFSTIPADATPQDIAAMLEMGLDMDLVDIMDHFKKQGFLEGMMADGVFQKMMEDERKEGKLPRIEGINWDHQNDIPLWLAHKGADVNAEDLKTVHATHEIKGLVLTAFAEEGLVKLTKEDVAWFRDNGTTIKAEYIPRLGLTLTHQEVVDLSS